MVFKAFRIQQYKSFIDSGKCNVQPNVTILAGQNESGKTNILRALEKLNQPSPVFSPDEFSFSQTDKSPEITYWFELLDEDIHKLQSSFPQIEFGKEVTVCIRSSERSVYFTSSHTEKEADEEGPTIPDTSEIEACLVEMLPKFVLFRTLEDELPDTFTVKDLNSPAIRRLATYLDCDFKKIFEAADQQMQKNLTQELSRGISEDFSAQYRQKDVQFEFDINSTVITIYIQDKHAPSNRFGYSFHLSQRSMGLRWYLNFYIALKGEMLKPGDVILIDEPGMYLHAKAQEELRDILRQKHRANQIIYTTHSPYLIDSDHINCLRLVEKESSSSAGFNEVSTIKEKIHRCDSIDTFRPITDAIGYSLNSELNLTHRKVLICEGVSDYYYIRSLELLLGKQLNCGITHANGCKNIGKIASLFLGLGISDIFALVDSDKAGIKERTSLIQDGMFDDNHFFTTHGSDVTDSAIEDIFRRDFFLAELLDYTADQLKTAASNSKEASKAVKYAIAKSLYEKALEKAISADTALESSGKALFENLISTINNNSQDQEDDELVSESITATK